MTDVAPVVFKKRTNKPAAPRARSPPPPAAAAASTRSSSSDSDGSDDDDDDASGARVKRRKTTHTTGLAVAGSTKHAQDLSKSTTFAADRSATIAVSEDATKASAWYTDAALAAAEAGPGLSKSDTKAAGPDKGEGGGGDGTYRGTAQYSTFIAANPDRKVVGPVKAPTAIRTITVTDFAPDVCKDYKQTGFCGFGDSCKFLHAREDYAQGWQLDKEWEAAGKNKKPGNNSGKDKGEDGLDEEEKMLQDIPFVCILCKGEYKAPVVTKCGHYFCGKCAMARYQKEKKKTCAACGRDTQGSFAVAKKLVGLLERKRKRAQERREAEGADAEEES